ncbi:hypothetical protein ACSBR2_012593 [Camellia fascicularis]
MEGVVATLVHGKEQYDMNEHRSAYKIYIFKVLKQVHLDIRISSKDVRLMNSFINNIFEKFAQEASRLVDG